MHGAQAVGGYYTAGSNHEPKKQQMGYYAANDVNNAGYPDTYHDANQVWSGLKPIWPIKSIRPDG